MLVSVVENDITVSDVHRWCNV